MSAHDALDRLDDGVRTLDNNGYRATARKLTADLATVRERLDTLTAQVEQLTQERDDEKELTEFETSRAVELARQRDAAEADNARLNRYIDQYILDVERLTALLETTREGLRELADSADWYRRCLEGVIDRMPVRDLDESRVAYDRAYDKANQLLAASSPPPGDTEGEQA